jgi:hypothetical protein
VLTALGSLKAEGVISDDNFELIFQGSGTGIDYSEILSRLHLQNIVQFTETVSYFESLTSMMEANALLLIQGIPFNLQIPAKVYDYIYTRKPIIGVTSNNSATADVLKEYSYHKIGQTDFEISLCIKQILLEKEHDNVDCDISSFSRETKTNDICKLLESIASVRQ